MKVKNQYLKILEYLHLFFETRRWSLTSFTKRVSHRGSLLKGVAVQWVLYQSILNAKFTGRKKLGRKMCTSNRNDHKLENTVKKSWFKHLGELHKEWTEAGVRSILPGLRRRRTGSVVWRITNVILCLIWIHVLTKRCRARQRCLRLFPDHLGLGQLCLL